MPSRQVAFVRRVCPEIAQVFRAYRQRWKVMSFSDFANRSGASLTRHIPPGQFGRYLLVGAWNTLFGYGSYALLTAILTPVIPHAYIFASVISSLLNILRLVPRVQVVRLQDQRQLFAGMDSLRRRLQWRHSVRSAGVTRAGHYHSAQHAVRHAGALHCGVFLTAFMVVYSFVGHKKFSFRTSA